MLLKEKEYKDLHYQLWDDILNAILVKHKCIKIDMYKREWFKGRGFPAYADCFVCEFAEHTFNNTLCRGCPSTLYNKYQKSCLSGVYTACVNANNYIHQADLARLIRDSWREIKEGD